MSLDRIFLECSVRRLNQLASRIDDCLGRLTDTQIWARGGENENAIGNIVLHLCGNLRQWIVSGAGGAPDVRDRDAEFAAREGAAARELAAQLGATVRRAATVIEALTAARLEERVRIQHYDVTVLEAVYHVVEHFAEHAGQVIFATKAFTGKDLGYYAHLNKSAHREKTP
ncbi:MAG: DinB family protein [Acidobacteriota bacterium]